jgi:prepilin-type N-terminal cleavage/methylation domain-containing protein
VTPTFDSARRAARAFTLIEIVIVLFVVGSVMGLAAKTVFEANRRFRDASRLADARVEIGLAAERIARDIKEASLAEGRAGVLVLTRRDGSVLTWGIENARLVRVSPEGRRHGLARLAGMAVSVAEPAGPGAPFVEVTLTSAPAGGARGQTFYVGARPRVLLRQGYGGQRPPKLRRSEGGRVAEGDRGAD